MFWNSEAYGETAFRVVKACFHSNIFQVGRNIYTVLPKVVIIFESFNSEMKVDIFMLKLWMQKIAFCLFSLKGFTYCSDIPAHRNP